MGLLGLVLGLPGRERKRGEAEPGLEVRVFYFIFTKPFLFSICLQKDLRIVQINLEFECRGGDRGKKIVLLFDSFGLGFIRWKREKGLLKPYERKRSILGFIK
jgi:hypothetical protein